MPPSSVIASQRAAGVDPLPTLAIFVTPLGSLGIAPLSYNACHCEPPCRPHLSLRASAHTGVAIRPPKPSRRAGVHSRRKPPRHCEAACRPHLSLRASAYTGVAIRPPKPPRRAGACSRRKPPRHCESACRRCQCVTSPGDHRPTFGLARYRFFPCHCEAATLPWQSVPLVGDGSPVLTCHSDRAQRAGGIFAPIFARCLPKCVILSEAEGSSHPRPCRMSHRRPQYTLFSRAKFEIFPPNPLTNPQSVAIIHKLSAGSITEYGGIAQLGERLNGIQEVSGSIPLISTRKS